MPRVKCSCIDHESPRKDSDEFQNFSSYGWESRIGYGIAVSLTAFEIKRLLVIVIEVLIQWNAIRIVGGSQPTILSFIDISLGFTSALGITYILRGLQTRIWGSTIKQLLKSFLTFVIISIIMNIFTLVSIGYNVSIRKQTIASVFNYSMNHYLINESDKLNIDQLQFDLQCCGHTNYVDWFALNWQIAKSPSHHVRNADINHYSVPFSCCRTQSMSACIHIQMTKQDIKTIYNHGCSSILSNMALKIVFIACMMGATLIISQIFLAVCIIRMLSKSSKEHSRCFIKTSQTPLLPGENDMVRNYYRPRRKRRVKHGRSKKLQICMEPPKHYSSQIKRYCCGSDSSLNSFSNFHPIRIQSLSIHSEHCIAQGDCALRH